MIGWRRVATSASSRSRLAATCACGQPCAQRRQHPAAALDLLDQRPGLRGQLLGQPLDEPAAAGRVEHAAQLRLLEQDELGVARDAPGEWRGRAQRVVERQHRDAAGTAGGGGERRHRAAQDVHVRIDAG